MAHKTTKKNKRKTMSPDKKGKVNISSVNKKQKTSKVTKLSSTLKNQKGPKRDELGQFTSGSGGLNVFKKFNFKRALPLIIVIAIVGGLLVFGSFAATPKTNPNPPANPAGLPAAKYRYSASKCSAKDALCIGFSSEAMATRMLATRGYGKDPSNVPLLIARDLQSSARDINPGTKEMYTSLSNDLQAGKPLAMVNMDGFTDKVYCPPEQRMEACIAEAVRRAVEGAFGRDPSSAEGNYWKKMVTNGTGPVAMTRQLLDTEESAFHNYYLYLVWSKYVATGERPTSNNPFTDAKPSSSSSSNLVKIQNNSTSETNTTANQSTTVQSNGGSSIFEQIFNRVFRRNR